MSGDEPKAKKPKLDDGEEDDPQPGCSKYLFSQPQTAPKDNGESSTENPDLRQQLLDGLTRLCSKRFAEYDEGENSDAENADNPPDNAEEIDTIADDITAVYVEGFNTSWANGESANNDSGTADLNISTIFKDFLKKNIGVGNVYSTLAGLDTNVVNILKIPDKKKGDKKDSKSETSTERTVRCLRCEGCDHWVYQCTEISDFESWSGRNLSAIATNASISELETALREGRWDLRQLDQALLHVVVKARYDACRLLLLAGADVGARDRQRRSSIHLAIQKDSDNSDLLKLLLQHMQDRDLLTKTDYSDDTPMHRAALKGATNCMQVLLDAGVPVDIGKAKRRDTPLFKAAYGGPAASVRWLIAHGADPSYSRAAGDATPLLEAAQACKHENIKALLDSGVDVNALEYSKSNALHYCGSGGRREGRSERFLSTVKYLVEAGCEVNAMNDSGETPLSVAILEGSETVTEYLLSHGAKTMTLKVDRRAIREACARESFLRLILRYDPNALTNKEVKAADATTSTPEVPEGKPEVPESLPFQTPEDKDKLVEHIISKVKFQTDADEAMDTGDSIVVNESLSTNADELDAQIEDAMIKALSKPLTPAAGGEGQKDDSQEDTPQEKVRKMLLKFGMEKARKRKENHGKIFPVHWAVKAQLNSNARGSHEDVSALEFLLKETQFGAKKYINESLTLIREQTYGFDRSGRTPLTEACFIGLPLTALTLLRHGADVTLADGRGCTPLTTIVGKDQIFDVIDMRQMISLAVLIQFGVDVEQKGRPDYDRRIQREKSSLPDCPLTIACRMGCLDFVQMLWLAGASHSVINQLLTSGVKLYKSIRRTTRKKRADRLERKITAFLHSVAERPRSLQDLARITVRRTLGSNLPEKVGQLALPTSLAEYLFVPEVEQYIEEVCRLIDKKTKSQTRRRSWITKPLTMIKAGVSRTSRPEQGTVCPCCEEINCQDPEHNISKMKKLKAVRHRLRHPSLSSFSSDDMDQDYDDVIDPEGDTPPSQKEAPAEGQEQGQTPGYIAVHRIGRFASLTDSDPNMGSLAADDEPQPGPSGLGNKSAGDTPKDGDGDGKKDKKDDGDDDDDDPSGRGVQVVRLVDSGSHGHITVRFGTSGGSSRTRDPHELLHLSDEDSYTSSDDSDEADENTFVTKLAELQRREGSQTDRDIFEELRMRRRRLDAVRGGMLAVLSHTSDRPLPEVLMQRMERLHEPLEGAMETINDVMMSVPEWESWEKFASKDKDTTKKFTGFVGMLRRLQKRTSSLSQFLEHNTTNMLEMADAAFNEAMQLMPPGDDQAVVAEALNLMEAKVGQAQDGEGEEGASAEGGEKKEGEGEGAQDEEKEADDDEHDVLIEGSGTDSEDDEDVFWEEFAGPPGEGMDELDDQEEDFIANMLLK